MRSWTRPWPSNWGGLHGSMAAMAINDIIGWLVGVFYSGLWCSLVLIGGVDEWSCIGGRRLMGHGRWLAGCHSRGCVWGGIIMAASMNEFGALDMVTSDVCPVASISGFMQLWKQFLLLLEYLCWIVLVSNDTRVLCLPSRGMNKARVLVFNSWILL